MIIPREQHLQEIRRRLELAPVVAIIGARQVGKTTLAGMIADGFAGDVTRFDLEDPKDLARLSEPQLALEPLRGLIVLDEIQRLPGLFTLLRVLADRPESPARFLVLGSASPELLRQTAETLAGRISYYELPGFVLREVGAAAHGRLWSRGGFPRSFLAPDDAASELWRQDFVRTHLERDLPSLGINLAPQTMRRFWTMVAHLHGQLWNGSRLGAALGVAHTTARAYLDVLVDTYMVRLLPPWVANVGKRQVKSPKVYVRDCGLLHALLGILSPEDLMAHPVVGASWEGFAAEQVIRSLGVPERDCYFWATHAGAELDLLISRGSRLEGFEFKRTLAPSVTRSMRSALETLGLERLTVVYPGADAFPLASDVQVRPVSDFA
ncbi:MAG: ATP-binding protein [Candidatus Krumholzibacteriia bacterium]